MHRLAERRVAELCERRGAEWWRTACAEVWDYAERRTRAGVAEMPDGRYEATETVEAAEGDLEIRAAVEIEGDASGSTSTGTRRSIAATSTARSRSPCRRAASSLRVIADPDAPASGGAYAPIEVAAPEGSLVNARRPAAVVAGNVETSSRIADCLLRAFGAGGRRAGPGPGDDEQPHVRLAAFTYYETIGGGQGGSAAGPGPSAVHVAMSTRSTRRSRRWRPPIRCASSATRARREAAARARIRGGDGVIRAITALEPCEASIISDRRRHPPRGAAGGEPGAPGSNRLNRRAAGAEGPRHARGGGHGHDPHPGRRRLR